MNKTFFIIVLLILFCSCEKTIDIVLPDAEEKMVVEGVILEGMPPLIILSKSQNYFSPIDLETIASLIVTDASIQIEVNGEITALERICSGDIDDDILEELSNLLDFKPSEIKENNLCFYTSSTLIGEYNTQYNLRISRGDNVYTSNTYIPLPVKLDSVWFELEGSSEQYGKIWATINDPADEINYYRWQAKRINLNNNGNPKDFVYVSPSNSVFDDKFFNGLDFDAFFYRGKSAFESFEEEEEKDPDAEDDTDLYSINDTIAIRFSSLDYDVFKFYQTVELNQGSAGNPFANPSSVMSNIEGGALGVWAGYGSFYDTIYPGKF